MKISIDGHHFNTEKATSHWRLDRFDGSNRHMGSVYLSSTGVFYIWTPSQWANRHSWVIMSASDILCEYDQYLGDDEKAEIAEAGKVEWE